MNEIKIKPIGHVKNHVKEPRFGNFAHDDKAEDAKIPDWVNKLEF